MKIALLTLGSALALGMVVQAGAQTCAAPLTIASDSVVNGDLCTATNDLPGYGNTASPQNEIIYSFVAQSASATIAVAQGGEGTWTGGQAAVFLMPSPCSTSTDPTAFGFGGTDMAVNGTNSPDGATMYVIFTSDPGGSATACGTYTGTVVGTLPVTLQSFTVG